MRVVPVPGTVLVLLDRSASMDIERVERLFSGCYLRISGSVTAKFSLLKYAFSEGVEPLELAFGSATRRYAQLPGGEH